VDRGKLYTTIGDVTLVAGAVGLVLGATLVIVGSHSTEHASVSLCARGCGREHRRRQLVRAFLACRYSQRCWSEAGIANRRDERRRAAVCGFGRRYRRSVARYATRRRGRR